VLLIDSLRQVAEAFLYLRHSSSSASFAGAAAARNRFHDLYLFTILFDQMADVDEAAHAGVRGFQYRQELQALKAGVVGLYGVVVVAVVVRVLWWCPQVPPTVVAVGRVPGSVYSCGTIFIDYSYTIMIYYHVQANERGESR
jgi:hypothetical protein